MLTWPKGLKKTQNLTEGMIPRLALEGQERVRQEWKRGSMCAKTERLKKTRSIQELQLVCIARGQNVKQTEQVQREQRTKGLVWHAR